MAVCLGMAMAVGLPGTLQAAGAALSAEAHRAEIEEWRASRHQRLSSDSGWLSLVGLEWLQDGANRLGTTSDSDVKMPGGPADWGTIVVAGDELQFLPPEGGAVTVDGQPPGPVRLVADSQGEPTVVRSGNLSFYVIERGSFGLRIKDTRAPTLVSFTGMDNYPIAADWRFEAAFLPAEPGQTIEIADVLGRVEPMEVYGTAVFEHEGKEYSLLGLREAGTDSMWFLFADRTSGRETYGAGRFLYSDGMPENGRVVVDFNKSYNPPCAFTDYSTCPLPPQQNRLDVAVTAGEKKFHHD